MPEINCSSNYDSTNMYVTVFSFPKDEEIKKTWIKCIHRESFNPTKHSAVCIKHFAVIGYKSRQNDQKRWIPIRGGKKKTNNN
jgi:hypothetical protein